MASFGSGLGGTPTSRAPGHRRWHGFGNTNQGATNQPSANAVSPSNETLVTVVTYSGYILVGAFLITRLNKKASKKFDSNIKKGKPIKAVQAVQEVVVA